MSISQGYETIFVMVIRKQIIVFKLTKLLLE